MKKKVKWILIGILVLAAIGAYLDREKKEDKPIPAADVKSKESADNSGTQPKDDNKQKVDEKQDPKSDANASTTPEPEPAFNPADYATNITYEDLARYPDDHSFKALTLTGEVVQVMKTDKGTTQCRLAVNGDHEKMILIEFEPDALKGKGRILENDTIKVYGTSIGIVQYKSILGQKIEIPAMLVKVFELVQK